MKIKLVMISETLMDGVGKHIVDLLYGLNKELYDVHIIHGKLRQDIHFEQAKKDLQEKVAFYEVKDLYREITPIHDVKAILKINRILKKIQPDIIHCHSSKAGVLGRLLGKYHRVKKCFYTPHAYSIQNKYLSSLKKWLYTAIERHLAKYFTTKIVHVSYGEMQFSLEHKIGDKKNSVVIYNSIKKEPAITSSKETIIEELKVTNNQIIIGCVARLFEQKNPFLFIEIAKTIVSLYDNVVFLWVGNGEYLEEIQQLIQNENLQDKILMVGFKADVDNYLQVCDIYLSTSLYEGLPYTLIEAARSHLPMVASDVVGNNEVVQDGYNGFLFDLDHEEEAVLKLSKLIDESRLREELGENSYRYFLDNFTIEKMIREHEALYKL